MSLLFIASGANLWAGGPPLLTVRGHGVWGQASGLPEGGNFVNQTSINAWLNPDGTADGVIEWTAQLHTLPGDGGQLHSGYPWTIRVQSLSLLHADEIYTHVYITGLVVNSGQNPSDIGAHVELSVVDWNGPDSDFPDELNGVPLDAGNFTIK